MEVNSTNLNLFYGEELLIFFFIVCFFFFSPPSCQPSSTWIELFDLRAAVQKEEEMPLPSISHLPHPAMPRDSPSAAGPHGRCHRAGAGLGRDFPKGAGAAMRVLAGPTPLLGMRLHSAPLVPV